MPESDQAKASRELYEYLKGLQSQISGFDPNITNLFKTYRSPFDYRAKSRSLDEIFNQSKSMLDREAAMESAQAGKSTAERMASQGITGGSVLEDSIAKRQSDVSRNRFSSLAKLKGQRLALEPGLMEQENRDRFNITGATQNVDMQNMMNMFRKYGLLQSGGALQGQAIGGLENDTWLDDLLASGNTLANIISAFSSGGGGGDGGD